MIESLAHYKLLGRMGSDGIGEVFRARDSRLGRTVAIKLVTDAIATDSDRRERFLRDARASAALSHPNIAALFEIGEDQGRLFLAIEFVPGETLSATIGGRPMNPRRALDVALNLADALAEAHAAGLVHRALDPRHVIVTPKGTAKILDFGLSQWTRGEVNTRYTSPEQTLGGDVDYRTDIFSMGVIVIEMLTGAPPAQRGIASTVNSRLPREIDAIVTKAVAGDRESRYQSAAVLAADLRSIVASLEQQRIAAERSR